MLIPPIVVLDRALRDAGIPIDGVSVGDPLVRSTWHVAYLAVATPAQRTQGDALLATIDPQDLATLSNLKGDLATAHTTADLLQSIAQGLWECIPSPLMTKAQLRTRIIAIYRALL